MEKDIPYNLILGSHLKFSSPDYFLTSVDLAIDFNENGFMIFTGAPQNTKREPFSKYHYQEGKEKWLEKGYKLENIIVHCPYIVNPASPDNSKLNFAISFLAQDIKRLDQMGLKYYVLHPGKYMDSDLETGIKNCAYVINEVHKMTKDSNVVICLETMSGSGTDIASKFINLKDIIVQVKNKDRIGVCIDTCHIWDAGYDVKDPDNVLKDFDSAVGLKYLKCFHINDSKNPRGSKKDRHENIGYGKIGFDAIVKWIFHPKTDGMIKVLETPFFDGKSPYKKEIEMIKNKKFEDWKNGK